MSTSFTVTRDQIIQSALRKLGVLEIGDVPGAETVANASLNLNLLIKQFATNGLKLWTINEGVMPLTANKTMYNLGGNTSDLFWNANDPTQTPVTDRPLKIIQAWIRNMAVTPPVDIPLMVISQQEYNVLGSKYSTGVANTLYYNPRVDYGELNVYLTPDATTATNYQVHFMYQRPLKDITTAQSLPDFPNEWMNCLVWNLADQMALEYSVPGSHRQEIAARAKAYRDDMADWDVDVPSVYFSPNMRLQSRNYGNNA